MLLTGCATPPAQVANSNDPPVRYARYVQVATFDATPRPATTKLNVLQDAPTQKFHPIAQLTIDGESENEGKLINALAWKARQLGADALLMLPPVGQRKYSGFGVPEGTHWAYRAQAIVFDSQK